MFLIELANPNTNISIILPEIIVAVAGTIVMLYDSFFPKQRVVTGIISLIGLVFAAIALGTMWLGDMNANTAWNGMIAHDNLRLSFSFVMLFASAMTILISTVWTERENIPIGEYHSLLMFATVGMLLMASGNDLVVIFLGLETMSIATLNPKPIMSSAAPIRRSAGKFGSAVFAAISVMFVEAVAP